MIKADHRRHSIGIPRIQRACKHQHIHDNRDGRNPVLPNITKHGPVKHHGNDSGNQCGGHLRASVCGSACEDFQTKDRPCKVQQALFPDKDRKSHHRRYGVSQPRCNRRTADSPINPRNKHIVKRHIQHAACHGTDQRQGRLFTGYHVQGKIVHQKNRNRKEQITAQVFHTICLHLLGKIHPRKDTAHHPIADHAHESSRQHIHQNQESKVLPCLPVPSLSHLFHNDRTSPRGKHGGDCRHKLNHGCGQINRRKGIRADQIRNEQTVNHCVKRHKYCHGNGRNGKFQNIRQSYRFFINIFFFHTNSS